MSEVFITHNLEQFERALRTLGPDVMQRAARDTARIAERELLRRFRRTVATWRHQPQFDAITDYSGAEMSVLVRTDDEIYGYVDRGTRPHMIFPRGQGYPLRFQAGYNAKTTPGSLTSGPGGPYGATVRAWSVKHPGTAPRHFSEQIQKEMGPNIFEKLKEKVRELMRKHFRGV